jgi:hypothetical protein
MNILTPARARVLSSFLLLTNMSFAWRDMDVSLKHAAGMGTNSAVTFATVTFLADAAQQSASPAKANSRFLRRDRGWRHVSSWDCSLVGQVAAPETSAPKRVPLPPHYQANTTGVVTHPPKLVNIFFH